MRSKEIGKKITHNYLLYMTERLGKILKSTCQKWKKVPFSRAKNDWKNSIFFRSRSQKKRLKIRSKSELAFGVKRD